MDLIKWVRSRAVSKQALNLHAVMRERPDLIEQAFAGPNPRGWRRSLIDAGVDPYTIVHALEDTVECKQCGRGYGILVRHLLSAHGITGHEYRQDFGSNADLTSEIYRAGKFVAKPIVGIPHWEKLWSRYYVIDWIIRLHEEGHNLNFMAVADYAKTLAHTGWAVFASWDAAIRAAGLDPYAQRRVPPRRQWTRAKVIDALRDHAELKRKNWRRQMPHALRCAMQQYFKSPKTASRAAGLDHQEISARALFKSDKVMQLVAAIRALENLKGRERRDKLDAIYHKNAESRRIVTGHFGSLKKLAASQGIDSRVVATEVYRDEADVQHDLDLLEHSGKQISFSILKNGHKRLYNVMRETGWGVERLKAMTPTVSKFPPCNPRSGLLQDRMIILRRKLRISMSAAARNAGVPLHCWSSAEQGLRHPSPTSRAQIERLLDEYQIPVSTAPITSGRSN